MEDQFRVVHGDTNDLLDAMDDAAILAANKCVECEFNGTKTCPACVTRQT